MAAINMLDWDIDDCRYYFRVHPRCDTNGPCYYFDSLTIIRCS